MHIPRPTKAILSRLGGMGLSSSLSDSGTSPDRASKGAEPPKEERSEPENRWPHPQLQTMHQEGHPALLAWAKHLAD